LVFQQGDFNVISRDISKALLKRETVVCYKYPASAYQINKKITVMILKEGKFTVDRQSS
jgi:hypothetical protein